MPAILPRDPRQLVTFALEHAPVWQQHAAELGLSAQQVQELLGGTSDGAATAAAAQEARYASLAATKAYYRAAARLRDALGACMATIHATAAAAGTTAPYIAAQVPVPKKPGRSAGEPARPQNLRATLLWDGAIRLDWSARQPAGVTGVVTLVMRRLPGAGDADFRLIDLVGGKTWTDRTLPAGAAMAEYQLRGRRGDRVGPLSNILSVPFGSGIAPQSITTTAAKLAA